jgi:hypothetical protein
MTKTLISNPIFLNYSTSVFFETLLKKDINYDLYNSIKENGILCPIVFFGKENGFVIDGIQRLQISKDLNLNTVPTVVLNDVKFETALGGRLIALQGRLSLIQKLKIIHHFHDELKLSRSVITNKFLPLLQFPNQDSVLRKCLQVMSLPLKILDLCEVKKFSLKQCFQLTRVSSDLIESFSTHLSQFSFSASVFFECLDAVHDYLRKHNLSATSFWTEETIVSILNSKKTEIEKTNEMRNYLNNVSYPILLSRNQDIEKQVAKLPKPFKVKWDKALEIREVSLSLTCRSEDEFKNIVQELSKEETSKVITTVLDSL